MIVRRPLLIETLVSRQITRPGPVYMYRKPGGPPQPTDKKLDRTLWNITQSFDFSPLMNGDQQQARQVAQDFLSFLKKRSSQDGLEYRGIVDRLKKISPHIRRSMLTFHSYLDAQIKTK